MKKAFMTFLLSAVLAINGMCQEQVDMADTMRSEGKIWVVIAVILTIFAGIVLYLVRLDRKISKLEKGD